MDCSVSKRNERIFLIIMSAVFVLGMFVVSRYGSPLYPENYGGDYAIFTIMGKSMVEGKILYVDVFDHKGPIMFFIQALGCLLGGKIALLIIECILGIVTMVSFYYICKLIYVKQDKVSLVSISMVLISGFAMFFYTFSGGNMTEEYSLPFIAVSLLLMTKYVLNADDMPQHPVWYAFFYGIAIATVFLIRLNNATTICAGILVIFIYLIYKKEVKNLFMNLLFGLLGVITVVAPIMIYFALKGALYDMIYATFIYNFQYATNAHSPVLKSLSQYVILYLPLIISIVLFVINLVKTRCKLRLVDWLVLVSLIVNAASLWIANQYPHYFTVFVPLYMFTLCLYWRFNLKDVKTYVIVLCVIAYAFKVFTFSYANVKGYYIDGTPIDIHKTVSNCLSIIPEDEKDSFIGYNLPTEYYLSGDLLPCYKYYSLQDWWSKTNPLVNVDFLDWLETDKPIWVMAPADENCMSENEDVQDKLSDILENNYELKDKNKYMCLYRLIE